MGNHKIVHFIILLNLGTLLVSLACPTCPYPTPPTKPPKLPPSHPPKVKPPYHPKPPAVKPPPRPPKVTPPYHPKPPPVVPKPPPYVPKPPVVQPPVVPKPPVVPNPPVVNPPPPETPCPPPPSPPKAPETCPIDTLKLSACVDVLGGLVHVVIGQSAKSACCPVLEGLVGLDAAVCLCTTIKAKLLNVNILIPIALQLLVDCGKTPPSGFQCPA